MRALVFSVMVVLVMGLSGCKCPFCKDKMAPVAAVAEKPSCQDKASTCGGGAIRVTKQMPETVQVGKPFDYKILVENISAGTVSDVVVTEMLPENFDFKSADPAAKQDGNKLMWTMDSLDGGASQTIVISGTAKGVGALKSCANATYKCPACAQMMAVAPAITLTKTATEQALICDQIAIKYVVTNTGTGTATGVMINDTLPENLVTANGEKAVAINVGDVPAGQSKEFDVMAKAQQPGKFASKATASSDGQAVAESAVTTTTVAKPVLELAMKGSDTVYLGRPVNYELTLANKGDAASQNTMVEDTMPEGATFVSASDGGAVSGNKVVWNLGTVEAGASKTLNVSYKSDQAMAVSSKAMAMGTCTEQVAATASTQVKGIAAILLEMVDVTDPIEVGQNETYIVTITNQGSATDTNVKIKCVLEPQMKYVSSSGPTQGTLDGDTVTFAPLDSLAPKAQAKWEVIVTAMDAADVRFKTILTSDQLTREVVKTESTNFYK